MKTYVMSDIHGRDTAYFKMLQSIDFDNFKKRDKLYILGDCIDRGSGSAKVLKHIYDNREKITLLMGNHEKMMLTAMCTTKSLSEITPQQADELEENYQLWFYNGGVETYKGLQEFDEKTVDGILEYVANLPYYRQIKVNGNDFYLVHGSPYAQVTHKDDIALSDLSQRDLMLWREMKPHLRKKGKTVIFGHRLTAYYHGSLALKFGIYNKTYPIYKADGMIGIDCGCAVSNGNGRLACLRLQDMKEFYQEL